MAFRPYLKVIIRWHLDRRIFRAGFLGEFEPCAAVPGSDPTGNEAGSVSRPRRGRD